MSRKSIFTSLVGTLLILGAVGVTHAQRFQPFAPLPKDDLQWFSPAVLYDYGGETVDGKYGMFFTYDRLYVNMSRPDTPGAGQQGNSMHEGDFSWGNRFDTGYMREDDNGWLVSYTKIETPNTELIGNPVGPADPMPTLDLEGQVIPASRSTINSAKYFSVELDRVWRWEPGPRGMYLEPFLGVRFAQVSDHANSFATTSATMNAFDVTYTDVQGRAENNLLGGQVGCRSFTRRGRWILSAELRGFIFHNFQFVSSTTTTTSQVDTNLMGNIVTMTNVTQFSFDEGHAVYGGEIRAEVAYELTRNSALRFGLDFTSFMDGIGRGGLSSDEDYTLVALSFGLTVNR